jgi:hypothetical protein
MDIQNQKVTASLKVSYYTSYINFILNGGLTYWPFFVAAILTTLSALITRNFGMTVFLLFFSAFLLFFCAFVTRFYANSVLSVCDSGLAVKRKDKTISYNWSDITKVEYLVPFHQLSHVEIILTLYTADTVEYIFIESLRFKTATSRLKAIQAIMETNLENHHFVIQESNFRPGLLNKRHGPPQIRS